MAVFPRPAGPRALLRDVRGFLAERERHHVIGLLVAIAVPALILLGLAHDSRAPIQPASIIYVQSWPDSRSDAEIDRQNIADQKKLDAWRAERQRQFKVLAKQIGM